MNWTHPVIISIWSDSLSSHESVVFCLWGGDISHQSFSPRSCEMWQSARCCCFSSWWISHACVSQPLWRWDCFSLSKDQWNLLIPTHSCSRSTRASYFSKNNRSHCVFKCFFNKNFYVPGLDWTDFIFFIYFFYSEGHIETVLETFYHHFIWATFQMPYIHFL